MKCTAGANSHAANRMIDSIFGCGNSCVVFRIDFTAGNQYIRFTGCSIPTDTTTDSGTCSVAMGNNFTAGDLHLAVSVTAGTDSCTVIAQRGYDLYLTACNMQILNKRVSVRSTNAGIPVVVVCFTVYKCFNFLGSELDRNIQAAALHFTVAIDVCNFQRRGNRCRCVCVTAIVVRNIADDILIPQTQSHFFNRRARSRDSDFTG